MTDDVIAKHVRTDDEFQAAMATLRAGRRYMIQLATGTYGPVKTVIPKCDLKILGEGGTVIDGRNGQDAFLAHGEARVQLEHMTVLGGWRSCVAFGSDPSRLGKLYVHHCWLQGDLADGKRTKWGLITHGQTVVVTSTSFDRFLEHGVYAHNAPLVDCYEIRAVYCGRTAVQSVARRHENGGFATDKVIIENATLGYIGDRDGGGAITVQGAAWVEIVGAEIEACANGSAIVVWPEHDPASGKQGRRSGLVMLRDCELRSTGRPTMIVSGVDCLAVTDTAIEREPEHAVAVEIDDPHGGTAGGVFPTKQFIRGPGVTVRGKVTVGGAG